MEKITKILWNAYSELSDSDKGIFTKWYCANFDKTKRTMLNKFKRINSRLTIKEAEAMAKRLRVQLPEFNIVEN
jgi:hypothetical protein